MMLTGEKDQSKMGTSVALCTYNGAQFLEQQLDSILNQTVKVDEIVVCDDGSSDSTISILNSYKNRFPGVFRIYENPENLRSVKNFEKAISLCTNEIIFLSDQDDIWLPEKVAVMVDFFKTHEEIDVIATNGYGIDENNDLLDVYSVWDIPQFFEERNIEINFFHIIAFSGNVATGASMALRKSLFPHIIPFPEIKEFHHDEWIALNAAAKGNFYLMKDKLFKYRIHKNQQVGNVFFPKTEAEKDFLIQHFDYFVNDGTFISYKRMLKRIAKSYKKNKILSSDLRYNKIGSGISEHLENLFYTHKKTMLEMFPIRSRLLNISDQILNKRKLK